LIRSILAAIGVLQFEVEAHMKNPVWDDTLPHSEEEVKREIDRLTLDIQKMLESIGQTQERTARSREATESNLRWIRENLHARKSS